VGEGGAGGLIFAQEIFASRDANSRVARADLLLAPLRRLGTAKANEHGLFRKHAGHRKKEIRIA
jgi:hypothetical protein